MRTLPLLLLLLCNQSQAASIPFTEKLEQALNSNGAILDSGSSGLGIQRVARVVYDFAVDTGASGTTITPAKGAILPPKSVVTRITAYIDTLFTGAAVSRVRVLCGTAVIDNQRNYRVLPAGSMFTVTTGTDCGSSQQAITVLSTDAATTAGKVTYFIEYFVRD